MLKKERNKKGTTLHRRLLIFFAIVSVSIILAFTTLLTIFGINGKDEKTIQNHINIELTNIAEAINDDFGRISLGGITIAEDITNRCDTFFSENNIKACELNSHPEMIEQLLAEQMQTLMSAINNRYCGGVFILLDATVSPDSKNANTTKSGVFIKKTQPTSTQAVGVKLHYLRGPAQLARDNGIMLLGQWKMEYDITDQDFFTDVMNTARENSNLPISRLYYWSERVTLKGNSESGFLLCVPLRSKDNTVFGVCGIEVSDRLFKSMYSPECGIYDNIFTIMSPSNSETLFTSKGLIAGNYYLTGSKWNWDLSLYDKSYGFNMYSCDTEKYGGKTQELRLYPNDSPYKKQTWSVTILMQQEMLKDAIKGNNLYFIDIVIILVVISLIISILISRRFLRPVTEAIHSIKTTSPSERKTVTYLEINDLLDFLAEKDREHDEEIKQRDEHHQMMKDKYEKAQLEIARLAYSRKQEVDPDLYQQFLDHLYTLTPTERIVLDLYISGNHAKDILEIMNIKENTLKYHNKNIYSKLGVTSRKELLRYATLMNQEKTK